MEKVSAFVLAGGKSTRMGTDKAFLQVQGRTLLVNALELGRAVADQVRIVGDPAKFGEFEAVVEDVYTGHGPLGGIHAALTSSETDLNVVIGVDLPMLEPRFFKYLIQVAEESGATVTVPQLGKHYEPLCAVYRREFGRPAEEALKRGQNKIDGLFSGIPIRAVRDEELLENGFSQRMFRNVNTPEDWKLAQEEFARREHV